MGLSLQSQTRELFRACTNVHFNGEIRKLLNQGFLVAKLKSAYEKIDNPNHDWLTVTELCGKHTGSTAQLEENPFCLLNTPAIFASDSKIFQTHRYFNG